MYKIFRMAAILLGVAFNSMPVQASAVLNFDAEGKLAGAAGVWFNEESYSVSFKEGSCTSIFEGCSGGAPSFEFNNEELALGASSALLDAVFTGLYRTQPTLSVGCDYVIACSFLTPYKRSPYGALSVAMMTIANTEAFPALGPSGVMRGLMSSTIDTAGMPMHVFVVWQPVTENRVPEPPMLGLIALALFTLQALSSKK